MMEGYIPAQSYVNVYEIIIYAQRWLQRENH